MFALKPEDLAGKVLDCAAGPASFSAEATAAGHEVVSRDPLYAFTAEEIRSRIEATHETVVSNARAARDELVWREIESPEHLGEVRLAAMRRFLDDFPQGLREKRYLAENSQTSAFRRAPSTLPAAPTSCSPTPGYSP